MTLFNYILNNDLIFYSIFAGTAGLIGYKFVSSIWNNLENNSENNSDFDYLNTDLNTSSNVYSDVGIQTILNSVSTGTIVLPTPYQDIPIIPNLDMIVYNLHELKHQEILEFFGNEIHNNMLTDTYVRSIIDSFTLTQLNNADINEAIYFTLFWWN